MQRRPIILTGFMCSGKTSVVAALGEKLNSKFVDLDDVITAGEGRNPRQLITEDGEERFRDLETRYLEAILREGATYVIALGGGAWIKERNRVMIENFRGISVWLDASFELCWSRIPLGSDERPLARNKEAARELYEKRNSLYSLATIRIDVTENKSVDQIAAEIVAAMSND